MSTLEIVRDFMRKHPGWTRESVMALIEEQKSNSEYNWPKDSRRCPTYYIVKPLHQFPKNVFQSRSKLCRECLAKNND